MNNLVVTIMAAGEGKRMNSNIPKVLHLFKNIPILIRILLEVIKINPKKIIIITGKYDELIKKTIFEYINDINNIYFVEQKNPNGTGDAIKCTLDYYSDNDIIDKVLILNGDMPLISSDLLLKFIDNLENNESKLLVAELENPYGYGRIIYNNDIFYEIKEEKDCSIEEKNINIVNVGIYIFPSNILKKYIPMINNNNYQKEYYLTDIIKLIKNNSNININTYKIESNIKYQILGVNTQEELKLLENTY
jgi:UDP-N-acetylglucosamine diphosphorylase/glucosamine-1-phosphate N-acetyltransferase